MRRIRCSIVAGLTLIAAPLAAQRGLTAEQAAAMRQLNAVQLSPDGRWVAYAVTTADLKKSTTNSDLWLVSAAGGDPVRLTTHQKDDQQPRWSSDGKWIGFISSRDERPQVYRISPSGGEAEKLTDSKSGVMSFQWAPDGQRIAYVAARELTADEERKQKERDDAQVVDQDFIMSRLWIFDVASAKATLVVQGDFQVQDPQWSPDGKQVAYVRVPTPKADDGRLADVMVLDVASGQSRRLVDNAGPDTDPRWSPDGSTIAFLTKAAKNSAFLQSRLAVVPATGGTPVEVAKTFKYTPGTPTWSPDGKSLWFWTEVGTRHQLFTVAAAGGTPKQVSESKGGLTFFGFGTYSFAKSGDRVAFGWSDPATPDNVYVASLTGPWTPVRLTNLNPELASVPMGRGETVRWKSKDGTDVEGVVVYPPDYQPGKAYPTVVYVHGGPASAWNESFAASWYNAAQIYAGQGWVAFLPNPRGSTGYGEKFLGANYRDWGGGDFQDIQSGIDYLIKRGIADSSKLAQSGWSYGGYMTAWTLTQTNRFKAVMVGAGLTNMYSMYSTNDLQSVLEDYFGGEPWNDEQAYRRASAMMFIKQAKTPTLILHGAVDTRVPVGQAQELYMGLKKNGIPVQLVFFPREPHGLQEPRHGLDKIKREYAFFSKYVLGVEVKDRADLIP